MAVKAGLKIALTQGLQPDFKSLHTLTQGEERNGVWHVPTKHEAQEYFATQYRGADFVIFPLTQTQFVESDRFAGLKAKRSGYIAFVNPEEKQRSQNYWDYNGPERGTRQEIEHLKSEVEAVLGDKFESDHEVLIARWHNPTSHAYEVLSPERRSVFYSYGMDLMQELELQNPQITHSDTSRLRKGDTEVSRTYYQTNRPGIYWIEEHRWGYKDSPDWDSVIEWKLVRYNQQDEQAMQKMLDDAPEFTVEVLR